MELKTLEAQTQPITDLGEFEAIAAAWTPDREKDVIHRGAFEQTIRQWRRSGKRLPLHWDHKGDPDKIIGHIDPLSMQERPDGLFVKGQVDLDGSQLGREAWRLIKSGVVGLSFGYLPTQAKARSDGGRDLHELDMFEVSITPAPMHPDTRILSTKGMSVEDLIEIKAWDGSASGYTDEEYAKATILDRADCDASLKDAPPKTRYAVPIAVPGSSASDSPDRGGVIAAAGGRGLTRVNACAKAKANAARKLIAAYGKFDGLEAPDSIKALAHEGEKAIEAREQRKRAEAIELEAAAGKAVSDTPHPEPFSTSTTSNWVARHGGLPHYIQNIAHDLLEKGHAADESKAIEMAIGIVKNWAAGEGGVTAATRAKAAAAVAEWEKMKAEAHAKPGKSVKQQPDEPEDEASGDQVQRLQDMVDEGKEFIDNEDDANDKAMMEHVLGVLTQLLTGEQSENEIAGNKKLVPVKGAEKPAKSRRDRDGADDADVTGELRRVDPLRRQADAIALEFFSDGESLRKQSPVKSAPKPEPELSLDELKERMRDEMLIALAGGDESLVSSAE